MLARLKAEHAAGWGLTLLGIPPHFIHEIRTPEGLRSSCGIFASAIVRAVEAVRG